MLPAIYHRRADKTDVYTPAVLGEVAPPFQTLLWKEHARKRKRIASSFTLSYLVKLECQVDARVIEWTTTVGRRFADTAAQMDFASWSQVGHYGSTAMWLRSLRYSDPWGCVRKAISILGGCT
ncbi:hypothetical protein F4778DRAFT_303582 [Xylariomycetidae sp. FL2044]|nr:hypothetical protein F4778DRAFT_303582 [Xylariomycetidae sp. FL2044]